mgnify:CR=1 FL=1
MQALLALVRAEIKLHFSNRRAVLMSIVAPILIAAFFGSLFGGFALHDDLRRLLEQRGFRAEQLENSGLVGRRDDGSDAGRHHRTGAGRNVAR